MGAAFAILAGLIVVAAGAGWWGLRATNDTQARLDALVQARQDAAEARYFAADVSGWQGLVVGDIAAFGYAFATGPDGLNRAGVLESKAAVYDLLDNGHIGRLTEAERALWDQLRPTWDAYFAEDDAS